MEYEESLLRVPLENITRATRVEVRRLEKEWGVVFKALNTLADREEKGDGAGAEAVSRSLEKIEGKLRGMKRKMEDSAAEEGMQLDICTRRARLVRDAPSRPLDIDASHTFFEQATNRLICDYTLHRGYLKTAQSLAQEASITDQVDITTVAALKPITEALLQGDTKPALTWCGANRSALHTNHSTIELKLRIQECVEETKREGGSSLAALTLCRQHVAPLAGKDSALLCNVKALMGYLTFGASGRYASLGEEVQREDLATEFASEYLSISCVAEVPLFLLLLQAGVLCLNTGSQSHEGSSADPMTQPSMRILAKGLPALARKNSALVCKLTGKVMDDTNPPMATPRGCVYSQSAIRDIVCESEDGLFTCPKTGFSYGISELKKVYVM